MVRFGKDNEALSKLPKWEGTGHIKSGGGRRWKVTCVMGDYDFQPSGGLKLKGVKDKKIKKKKDKEKSEKPKREKEDAPEKQEEQPKQTFTVPKTEAERRFEELKRQRVTLSVNILIE